VKGGLDIKSITTVHERLGRLYADHRFDTATRGPELRNLASAFIWAYGAEGLRGKEWQNRVGQIMGFGLPGDAYTNHNWQNLVRHDAPRYEAPNLRIHNLKCEAPMIRRDRCDSPRTTLSFRVTDAPTGEWRVVGYCSKHREEGRKVAAMERARMAAGNIPEPNPNVGGLLPCHVQIKQWPDFYAWASPGWEPPKLGIRADDWPVLTKVAIHTPPALSVIEGEGLRVASGADVYVGGELFAAQPMPSLRIVKGGEIQ
jgi:hypothetical protein